VAVAVAVAAAAKATGKGEGLGGNTKLASVVKEFEFFLCGSSSAHLALLLLAGAAASDAGPTGTPLPDKKLLLFILDRLQK
jgi:bromodomain-containing protein 7/9